MKVLPKLLRAATFMLILFGFGAVASSVELDWPVAEQGPNDGPQYYISNGYGNFPHYGIAEMRWAIDFKHRDHYLGGSGNSRASLGKPVLAAAPGRVIDVEKHWWKGGGWYGRMVKIQHDDGTVTLYAHLKEVKVVYWQYVERHQQIGTIGDSGAANSWPANPHLHFEVRPNHWWTDTAIPEPMGGESGFFQGYPVRHNHDGVDNSAFVSDITIPDGTVMQPGQEFEKTWRIRNSGSTAWYHEKYDFEFDGGEQMGALSTVDFLRDAYDFVWAGSSRNISVRMRAPSTPGTYRGYWRMRSPKGNRFGARVWVEIRVQGPGTSVYVSESDSAPYNGAPGFWRWGTPSYWHRVGSPGLDGGMWWTYNNDLAHGIDNMGDWRPSIPESRNYEVFVHVPRNYATTTQARYEIYHANGRSDVWVNQLNYYDVWVSLGTYWFNSGTSGFVRLPDMTSEAYASRKIGYDAMKWEPR